MVQSFDGYGRATKYEGKMKTIVILLLSCFMFTSCQKKNILDKESFYEQE